LEQQQVAAKPQPVQPGMRFSALEALLQRAWKQSQAVTIQPDVLASGQYVAEIQGVHGGL
jgi:hypothetical protein